MRASRNLVNSSLFALALSVVPSQLCAQSLDEVVAESRRTVEDYLVDIPTPGFSIAVHLGDSLVWAEGFGLANVEHNVAVTTATRFRIWSISKSLTSAAVGLLRDRGLLDLDVPIQEYVPSFPEKSHPITTRQLGGHLSGLPHYGPEDYQNFVRYESVAAALDKFKDRPLLFAPGDHYQYSSFGFNLIGAVVEGVAGVSFLDFMQDEVFDVLGMHSTVADDYQEIIPDRAGLYEVDEGHLRNAPFTDNSDLWAAGGFLSTPTDLVMFGHGLLAGELLTAETLEILFTSQVSSNGEPTGYGFGWRVVQNDEGRVVNVSHGGSHFGGRARLILFPDQHLIVAATINTSHDPVAFSEVFNKIVQRFAELGLR